MTQFRAPLLAKMADTVATAVLSLVPLVYRINPTFVA
jgi:hypothetical protein